MAFSWSLPRQTLSTTVLIIFVVLTPDHVRLLDLLAFPLFLLSFEFSLSFFPLNCIRHHSLNHWEYKIARGALLPSNYFRSHLFLNFLSR